MTAFTFGFRMPSTEEKVGRKFTASIQTAWKYQYHDEGLGFRHALSLEYTFRPDLFLEMEYTYDSKLLYDRREDKRIWLRHVFAF